MKRLIVFFYFIVFIFHLNSQTKITLLPKSNFDIFYCGKKVSLYTLSNKKGLTLQVTNYGARIVDLWTPDINGNWNDIVLGYENIDRYINNKGPRYLGAAIGRYSNRIAGGKFTLDNVEYSLPKSKGHCVHGGVNGFDRVVWNVDSVSNDFIKFSNIFKDGEDGFPGNLHVIITYQLTLNDEFRIEYSATTDKSTPVSFTHHSFFNLKGEGISTICSHFLHLSSDNFLPVDSTLRPIGISRSVNHTPFDFSKPTQIGKHLFDKDEQLIYCNGYDHNFVVRKMPGEDINFAASVYEPSNGRYMEVWTTEPGIQLFTGNSLNGETKGLSGRPYVCHGSFSLETQHYPDSPNNINFPNTILKEGETYRQICIYKFGVIDNKRRMR